MRSFCFDINIFVTDAVIDHLYSIHLVINVHLRFSIFPQRRGGQVRINAPRIYFYLMVI